MIKLKKIFIVSALFVFLLNTCVYADFDNILREKYIVEYKYGDYISRTDGLIPILRIFGINDEVAIDSFFSDYVVMPLKYLDDSNIVDTGYILWAASHGIAKGDGTNFNGEKLITLDDTLVYIMRCLKNNINYTPDEAYKEAVSLGLIKPEDKDFSNRKVPISFNYYSVILNRLLDKTVDNYYIYTIDTNSKKLLRETNTDTKFTYKVLVNDFQLLGCKERGDSI